MKDLLETKKFGSESNKIIEKNGDLLLNQYFKLEIPYFEIIKTTKTSNLIVEPYNINELNINYSNDNCIVFFVDNNWYIVPEKLFILSNFN
jgi:hypothetical protein